MNLVVALVLVFAVAFIYLAVHRGWKEAAGAVAALGAAVWAAIVAFGAHF